jgi:signal peptidase I
VRQPVSRWHELSQALHDRSVSTAPGGVVVVEVPAAPGFVRALVRAGTLALEAAALLFLVLLFFVRLPQVNGRSMEPQLQSGEHVLINTLAYGFHLGDWARPLVDLQFRPIRPGDVVAFSHASGDASEIYLKRVVGVPGDKVAIVNGIVWVNGRKLAEPYVSHTDWASLPAQTVPRDAFFVLGDNRGDSDDSRLFGPVPRVAVIGRAALVVWPINRAGRIR